MNNLKYAIWLGVLLLLINLVARVPAHRVQWFVPQQLTFQASDYQGSLWSGSARQLVVGSQGATVALESLQWRLKPLSLLVFSPVAEVTVKVAGSELLSGELQWLGGQNWGGENLELTLPAGTIGRYAANASMTGQISLQLAEIQGEGQRIKQIKGNGSWQGARLDLAGQWLDLGTLAGDLAMEGEKLRLNFFDLSGPWDLDGQVLLGSDGKLEMTALVTPPPQVADGIHQGLALFGERQRDGKYRVEFDY